MIAVLYGDYAGINGDLSPVFLVIMIAPAWIFPLFHHTGPMKDERWYPALVVGAHGARV